MILGAGAASRRAGARAADRAAFVGLGGIYADYSTIQKKCHLVSMSTPVSAPR